MNQILQAPEVVERYQLWGKAVRVSTAPNLGAVVPKGNVVTRIEVPDQVAYLRLASMAEYAEDDVRIADFLASISDYPYLIIDIRSNGGGSDLTWMKKIVAPLLQGPINYTSYKVLRGGELAENYWGVKRNLLPIDALPKAPCYPSEVFSDFRYAHGTAPDILIAPTEDALTRTLELIQSR